MPSLFHRRDRSSASNATVTEFGGNSSSSNGDGSARPAPLGRTTMASTMGSSSRPYTNSSMSSTLVDSRSDLASSSFQSSNCFNLGSSVGSSSSTAAGRSPRSSPMPGQQQQPLLPPPSSVPAGQPPTAAMHNIRSVSELLNARKVYRAGYIYRLDDEDSGKQQHAHFEKYYVRLEDCILCLWSDAGLKRAQAKNTVIHPTSMNLMDGFVAAVTGSERHRNWRERCMRYGAPTEWCFALNTAGSNSLIFCCDDESDLRHWINVIRLAIWERQRLETLYTGIRFGIKEEQQLSPIRSAVQFSTNGAKLGRAEGLMDVRLPGDTEWKRVYAVLTDPLAYREGLRRAAAAQGQSSPNLQQRGGMGSPPIPQQPNTKKEKRKSVLSGFFGSSSSSSTSSNNLARDAGNGYDGTNAASPISSNYNQLLEDPQNGPTLALFGILSSSSGPSLPNSPSHRGTDSMSSPSMPQSSSITSLSSLSSVKLTNRPVLIVDQIWSTYAVWPENEALIPHSKQFKIFGRTHWRAQEIAAYSSMHNSQNRQQQQQQQQGVLSGFEESMRRENRDAGREGGEGQLLCMLVGGNTADSEAGAAAASGPGGAIRQAYREDAGGELLSWILGFYDAFKLHGRPESLVYNQRHPLSHYFAQPIGPVRGGLYFETPLIEDMPYIYENRPRAVSDQFSRMLYERMQGMGAIPQGVRVPYYVSSAAPAVAREQGHQRDGTSTPPVLPPIGGETSSSMRSGGRPASMDGRNYQNSAASVSPRITAGQLQAPASITERSSSPLRSHSPPAQQQQQQQAGVRTPYDTPPLATPRAVHQLARNDDFPTSREEEEDSLSQAFDRAMSTKTAALVQAEPSRTSTPSSSNHPTILQPGSANGIPGYGRKPSLDDVHQGRNGNGPLYGAGTEAMYMAPQPHTQESFDLPAQSRSLPSVPASSSGGSPSALLAAAAATLSTSPGSGETSTLEGHYNAFPVHSSSASSASIRSNTNAATPLAMPGQYIATPGLQSGPASLSGPRDDGPTPQRSLSPPGGAAVASTQAPSSFYTAGSPASQARTLNTASPAPSASASQPAGNMSNETAIHPSSIPAMEEQVLSDEPGALYALSLADEEDSQAASSVPVSRESSRESQQQQQYSQPGLSQMIQDRARAGGNGQRSVPSANASETTAVQPTSAGKQSEPPLTRSSTAGSLLNSAAPTSASAYSQAGTMRDDYTGSNGSTQPQGYAASMQPTPNLPTVQEGGLARNLSVNSDRVDVVPGDRRGSKVSSASTAEGQDDYLAGMNYLALTADQEAAQPVAATASSSSSPPLRPPRSPRMPNTNRPSISVQTGSPVNSTKDRNTLQNSVPASESASTMSPVEPLSPDPYGTYTEAATSVPTMRVVGSNSSPEQPGMIRDRSIGKAKGPTNRSPVSAGASSRKPGRRGVPMNQKGKKKLGSWSSDEEDEEQDKDSDAESEDKNAEQERQETQQDVVQQQAIQSENGSNARRESLSSSGSQRRDLPALPGPSTDPYINQNAAPSTMGSYPAPGMMPYDDHTQYAQYPQQRNSMFGWPQQPPMGMMAPWQQQQMMGNMSPYMGQGSGPSSPYSHSPSPSMYGMQQYQQGMGQNTMVGQMGNDGGADGKAARTAALAPHGLLQAGLADKQSKSAAHQEAMAKENGGPLVQLAAKPQGPQGGLVGAIANHERERKREGGIGATLTERERERRTAEARQREMDQMQARQASFGGMPGGPAFPGFGAMPNVGGGGFGGMDPAQMQQQMAMLAAQNAYLQAMAGFQNPGMQMGMGGPPSFMSPQFPAQPGFGGSQYAGSYLGMPQQQHSGSRGNSPLGHARNNSASNTPQQQQQQRGDNEYFRQ